ncbi:hypothetical protein [Butyricimonas paravirosa]
MKDLIKEITFLTTIILILGLFSSFSPDSTKENSQALRNIEALSEGENTPSTDCTVDVGRCIKNGIIIYGMSLKHENHEKTY